MLSCNQKRSSPISPLEQKIGSQNQSIYTSLLIEVGFFCKSILIDMGLFFGSLFDTSIKRDVCTSHFLQMSIDTCLLIEIGFFCRSILIDMGLFWFVGLFDMSIKGDV